MHVSMTSKQAAAALAAVLIGLSAGCTVAHVTIRPRRRRWLCTLPNRNQKKR